MILPCYPVIWRVKVENNVYSVQFPKFVRIHSMQIHFDVSAILISMSIREELK